MPEDNNKINPDTAKIEELERRLKQTEELLSTHRHTTFDKTASIDNIFYVTVHIDTGSSDSYIGFDHFFIATEPCTVLEIREVHHEKGTDAGAVTLQVERLQGTEGHEAGDSLLTTAFDLKGTNNTVVKGTLVKTNVVNLQPGDRLGLNDQGTLTALHYVCVTVKLRRGIT